jgi:hypothetical protein
MPRLHDLLFGILGAAIAGLLVFQFRVALFALVGAFACGSIYAFVGMMPSASEGFWRRVFTSVFLALVLSSLVLILPGTLGAEARRPSVQTAAIAIAAMLPVLALCFEIVRTPRVVRTLLRLIGHR